MAALNDDTIGRALTLSNRISLWLIKSTIVLASGMLVVAVATATIISAAIAGIFFIIFLPFILFGFER